jgi:hypothetical protein
MRSELKPVQLPAEADRISPALPPTPILPIGRSRRGGVLFPRQDTSQGEPSYLPPPSLAKRGNSARSQALPSSLAAISFYDSISR